MVDVKHNGLELGLKWPLLNQWNLTQGLFDMKNYNDSCNHYHCIAGYLFATVWKILYQQHISSLHAFSPLRDGCCADNISSCHSINLFCSCWISQWRMLFYAEYIVLFSLQIVLADYHKPYIFHFIIMIESKQSIDHSGISYYFDLKFECRSTIAFLWLVSIINYWCENVDHL